MAKKRRAAEEENPKVKPVKFRTRIIPEPKAIPRKPRKPKGKGKFPGLKIFSKEESRKRAKEREERDRQVMRFPSKEK